MNFPTLNQLSQLPRTYLHGATTLISLVLTSLIEYVFGRTIICACGYIKLWHGATVSSENSQHLTDWYTFSHLIHGLLFFYLGKYILKKLTLFQSFVLALSLETIWKSLKTAV